MNDVLGNWIPPDEEDGNAVKALRVIGQAFCGLRGHQALVHFTPGAMHLECTNCGWRSAGIEVPDARRRLAGAQ